jgi:hypothetical protein
MRRSKRTYVVGGLALALALAFAGSSLASHPGGQIFIEEESPTAAPKKGKPKPMSLHVRTEATDDPATGAIPGIPPKATTAVIDFPAEKKFNLSSKLVPPCTANLAGTTTEQANSAPPTGCGPSLIGQGTAGITLPAGPGGAPVDFIGNVLVFAQDSNTILLHARFDALGTTTLIEGDLSPSPLSGQYGTRANFHEQGSATLPTVGPGGVGAIKFFDVTIKKKKKVKKSGGAYASAKKKVLSVVAGRCKDKVWQSQASFTYSDHPDETVVTTQSCTPKK